MRRCEGEAEEEERDADPASGVDVREREAWKGRERRENQTTRRVKEGRERASESREGASWTFVRRPFVLAEWERGEARATTRRRGRARRASLLSLSPTARGRQTLGPALSQLSSSASPFASLALCSMCSNGGGRASRW